MNARSAGVPELRPNGVVQLQPLLPLRADQAWFWAKRWQTTVSRLAGEAALSRGTATRVTWSTTESAQPE